MVMVILPIPVTQMLTVMLLQVPIMDTESGIHTMRLGASLRDRATLPSPLRGLDPSGGYPSRLRSLRSLRAPARRLASLTAACRTAPVAQRSTTSLGPPPHPPRAGASRRARRRPRLARPGRLRRRRALPPARPGALRASPVPASPRTGLRTTRCTAARTSAVTAAFAFGSVLRTTACGSRRTVRHSIAGAAPLRRLRRLRFPER